MKFSDEYIFFNPEEKRHFISIDGEHEVVHYNKETDEWTRIESPERETYKTVKMPESWIYLEPVFAPLSPLLEKASELPWSLENNKRFGDWVLNLSHLLTEPTCPQASVYPEFFPQYLNFTSIQSHPYDAIRHALIKSINGVLGDTQEKGDMPITSTCDNVVDEMIQEWKNKKKN